MLDVIMEVNQVEEIDSVMEDVGATNNGEGENLITTNGKQTLKRMIPKYYDRQQSLELVLAAQELFEFGNHELGHINLGEHETCGMDTKNINIWEDTVYMGLLKEGILLDTMDFEESKKAKNRIINYCWEEQRLYFKGLFMLKLEEIMALVIQMHEDLGHFGE